VSVVARTYARALYEAAQEHNRVEPVLQELSDFLRSMQEVPELRTVLRDPQLDPRAKVSVLEQILGEADELVRNFLVLLAERGRVDELEEIERELERIVAAEAGQLSLEVTTAVQLSDEEFRELVRQIEQASGRTVEATRRVDPDLIGGVVLQVGSMRVDASVRGRLERLHRELATT
jgi:F-type H+-transporting ATPase subunit delta